MKWRKQHDQILNKMTRKQEAALAKQLRDIECSGWSEPMTYDECMAWMETEFGYVSKFKPT